MNRRHLIRILAVTVLGTSACVAGAAPAPAGGDDRKLRVGQTLRYDSGLKVTFLAVRKDHRCPINATCISAGDAEVVLRVKAGNQAAKIVRIHTDLEPREFVIPAEKFPSGVAGIPKSYVIGIARLTPLPTAGQKTLQSDYRLKLRISVAL